MNTRVSLCQTMRICGPWKGSSVKVLVAKENATCPWLLERVGTSVPVQRLYAGIARDQQQMLYLLSADTRKFILRTDPLRASLGPGGTTVTHGAPCKLPHPRGIAGPLRHCGARGSFPPYPPSRRPCLRRTRTVYRKRMQLLSRATRTRAYQV